MPSLMPVSNGDTYYFSLLNGSFFSLSSLLSSFTNLPFTFQENTEIIWDYRIRTSDMHKYVRMIFILLFFSTCTYI